jgi:branched-chain amino acid aminotransferase
MHRYILHNSAIHSSSERLLSPGQVGFLNGWGVFSTLRVCDGVLFAYERHFARMRTDAERMHVPFEFSPEDLKSALESLVAANGAANATLRVAVVRNRGGLFESAQITRDADLVAFTADLTNWGSSVKLGYKAEARHAGSEFTGTKITSWAQNLTWYEEAHQKGLDEYILLNEAGQISECTSANIFAVQGGNVITPPLRTSGCLPGVTRAILLDEIQLPEFTIFERDLSPSELENSDAVFITSTTRDLLPVREIDGEPISKNESTVSKLSNAFSRFREDYVASRRGVPVLRQPEYSSI